MANRSCPVQRAIRRLNDIAQSEGLSWAARDFIEKAMGIYKAIALGRADGASLQGLISVLSEGRLLRTNEEVHRISELLSAELEAERPYFESHVNAHYCHTGECEPLKGAPCQMACPARVDVPSYVALVGMARYSEALEVLWEDLPIPGILARVCVHPCEDSCRRGLVDEPISICNLKRVAFDRGLPSARYPKRPLKSYPQKVAIVGSGPAGLSCAYFLARKGYEPVIFEAMPETGGLLRYGIPEYRLPRAVLDQEVDLIRSLGVTIKTGIRLGEDFTLEDLRAQGFEAIFLGLGAWCSTRLGVEGEDHPNVIDCLTFLRYRGLRDSMVQGGIAVVGGGNAAIDCVRTAIRMGLRDVELIYRRTREEMPAHREEVEAAVEEGVRFTFLASPVKVLIEGGELKGLLCIKNRLGEPDSSGRKRPIPIEDSEFLVPAGTIIPAIGQEVDIKCLSRIPGISLGRRGRIGVEPHTLRTEIEWLFAGGDVVTGPATVIEAVAQGRRAANSMHAYLQGLDLASAELLPQKRILVPRDSYPDTQFKRTNRCAPKCIPMEERVCTFKEVMAPLEEGVAIEEAKRCLRCDWCIGCGNCVKTCRDQMGLEALKLAFVEGVCGKTDFSHTKGSCIGCGSCANACPTGAMAFRQDGEYGSLTFLGGELSTHRFLRCGDCQRPFISERHLLFIKEKAQPSLGLKEGGPLLCPDCERRRQASLQAGLPLAGL